MEKSFPKLIRASTVPQSLKLLLKGQLNYLNQNGFEVIGVSSPGELVEVVQKNEGIAVREVENEMKENFNKFYSFSVTRDPLSRIYSAYCYIKNNGGTHGGVQYEDYFDNKAFRCFDSFILEWLAIDDNINKNILFVPQNKYILDQDDKCMLNGIFKIEDKKKHRERNFGNVKYSIFNAIKKQN